jgi:hypothetical protein
MRPDDQDIDLAIDEMVKSEGECECSRSRLKNDKGISRSI